MDLAKRIIGIILVATVLVVVGILVFNFIRGRQTQTVSTSTNSVSQTETSTVVVNNTTPEPNPQTGSNYKVYTVNGLNINYPQNWGLLTCTNSQNFELDPYDSQDTKVRCDVALKPITVLVNGSMACKGDNVTIAGISVMKYRVENVRGTDYQWCFSVKETNYNITHRVSTTGQRGTGPDDFSSQIEEIIGRMVEASK